jgi:hypothetical protein
MPTENKKMQQRRDTAANWTSSNPILSAGEIGFETDTGKFKIGDGSTAWNSITDYFVKIPNSVSSTELGYLDGVTSAIQTQINTKAPTASPTFTGTVSGVTKSMVGLGNVDNTSDTNKPVSTAQQAAIDAAIAGLSWKAKVRAATTAAGTLATDFENGDSIDGVTLATGDRILIKNQASATENGIYVVAASGAPTRSTDADSGAELVNASVYVSEGTANADKQFVCTTNATITIGSTNITFTEFSSGGLSGLGSTDNALVRTDGTGGNTAQGSSATLSDAGNLTLPSVSLNYLDNKSGSGIVMESYTGQFRINSFNGLLELYGNGVPRMMVSHNSYDIYCGNGATDATPSASTVQGTGGNGSNVAGADLKIAGGKGTGTGGGGSVKIQTAPAGSSGSSLNSLVDAGEFDDDTTAGNTRFLLWDVTAGTLKRVSLGAADSGGTGYKVLRVAN